MQMPDLGALVEFLISLFTLLFKALDEEIFGFDISGMLGEGDLGDIDLGNLNIG